MKRIMIHGGQLLNLTEWFGHPTNRICAFGFLQSMGHGRVRIIREANLVDGEAVVVSGCKFRVVSNKHDRITIERT